MNLPAGKSSLSDLQEQGIQLNPLKIFTKIKAAISAATMKNRIFKAPRMYSQSVAVSSIVAFRIALQSELSLHGFKPRQTKFLVYASLVGTCVRIVVVPHTDL